MSDNKLEKRGLGRGLSALMADVDLIPSERPAPRQILPVEQLTPNPDQPRRHFAPEALQELAASLKSRGMLQPLIVRPHPSDRGLFQIVAGERRWRAAQIAQLHEVPVIVRDLSDTEVLEVAIVENIQRADLNAIEEAASYRQLMDRFGHTQEKQADALPALRGFDADEAYRVITRLFQSVLKDHVAADLFRRAEKQCRAASSKITRQVEGEEAKGESGAQEDAQTTLDFGEKG